MLQGRYAVSYQSSSEFQGDERSLLEAEGVGESNKVGLPGLFPKAGGTEALGLLPKVS